MEVSSIATQSILSTSMATVKKATVSNMNAHPIETCDLRRYARNYPFLFHLIPADGVLFQCDGDAPSPSKDYGQLQINLDQVVLRWWKITLRNIEGSILSGRNQRFARGILS